MADNLELTKKIKEIEFIKSEIVGAAAEILKKTAAGADNRDITQSISKLIIKAYILGDMLGIGFGAVDLISCELLKNSDGKNDGFMDLYRHINHRKG